MTYCESTQQKLAIQPLSPDEQRHLNDCPMCQARLRAEQSLSRALAEGPTYDDPQPPETETTLLASLESAPRPRRAQLLLLAAAVLVVVGPVAWLASQQTETPHAIEQVAAPELKYTPFVIVDPLSPGIAVGRGRLVRAQLPSDAPAAYGFLIPTTEMGIQADVLLNDDGTVYAVRFAY